MYQVPQKENLALERHRLGAVVCKTKNTAVANDTAGSIRIVPAQRGSGLCTEKLAELTERCTELIFCLKAVTNAANWKY